MLAALLTRQCSRALLPFGRLTLGHVLSSTIGLTGILLCFSPLFSALSVSYALRMFSYHLHFVLAHVCMCPCARFPESAPGIGLPIVVPPIRRRLGKKYSQATEYSEACLARMAHRFRARISRISALISKNGRRVDAGVDPMTQAVRVACANVGYESKNRSGPREREMETLLLAFLGNLALLRCKDLLCKFFDFSVASRSFRECCTILLCVIYFNIRCLNFSFSSLNNAAHSARTAYTGPQLAQ